MFFLEMDCIRMQLNATLEPLMKRSELASYSDRRPGKTLTQIAQIEPHSMFITHVKCLKNVNLKTSGGFKKAFPLWCLWRCLAKQTPLKDCGGEHFCLINNKCYKVGV